VHALGVVVPLAYLLDVLTWTQIQGLLAAGTAGVLLLEYLRLSGRITWIVFDQLTREYERESVGAYVLYALGVTLVAFAVPPRSAVPAMLLLALADPISGLLSSRREVGVKRGYVLVATFGVSVLLASLVDVPLWPAIAGGVATTAADGVKPVVAGYVLDDDFTIPVASALAIELVWRLAA
jgi:dolichol kinase